MSSEAPDLRVRRYIDALSQIERRVFVYLPATGFGEVSGPAMSTLIRLIWRKERTLKVESTIGLTGPRKAEHARLSPFGQSVRALLVAEGTEM